MPPKPRSAQQEQQQSSSEDAEGTASELREIKSAVYPLALKVHQIDDKVSDMKQDVNSQLTRITDQFDDMKQDIDSQLSSVIDQVEGMKQDIAAVQKNIDSKLADAITKITDEIKKSLESITGITATKSVDIKKQIDSKLAATASKIDELKKDIDPKLAETVSKINGVADGMKKDIDSKLINVASKVDKIHSEVAKLDAVRDAANESISLLQSLQAKAPRMGNFVCHWDSGDLHHVFEIKLLDDRSPEAVSWFRRVNFSSLTFWTDVWTDNDVRVVFNGVGKNDWFRTVEVDWNEAQRRHDVIKSFSDVDNLLMITKIKDHPYLTLHITQSLRFESGEWDNAVIGRVVNYDKATLRSHLINIHAAAHGRTTAPSKVSKDHPIQWY